MAPRLRKMRPYHPRRRRGKNFNTYKQELHDLEHQLSREINSLLLLFKEGNAEQIENAKLKAKSDLLKHSEEMQKVAQHLGDRFTRAVRDFLDSADLIVHSESKWIDEAKVRRCYLAIQTLEKEIAAA
jgi:hypothetical protein